MLPCLPALEEIDAPKKKGPHRGPWISVCPRFSQRL